MIFNNNTFILNIRKTTKRILKSDGLRFFHNFDCIKIFRNYLFEKK